MAIDDQQLILGVLVAQAGFATPAQVVAAAAARLLTRDGRSLLDHLVDAGDLSPERRALVLNLAEEALTAREGDPHRVLQALGGEAAVERTFGPADGVATAGRRSSENARSIPLERPGQYTRIAELGRGGQSIVWRAMDESIGREVALKELLPVRAKPGSSKSPGTTAARERFLREARLTARLDHPGIIAIHELGQREDGTLFCTQKLVRGETLKAALAGARSSTERLGLLPHIVDACQAIAYAHSRGVVHRDLKPSNIMLSAFGETVVVDWGLAKEHDAAELGDPTPTPDPAPEVTLAGVALGTPAYMSPEQARGEVGAIDTRTDVFNLGAVLYEVITGRPPFAGATTSQVIAKVLAGEFKPVRELVPDAPPELAAICERALDPDPRRRYADAGALAQELSAFRAGGLVSAYAYRSVERFWKFIARHRTAATAVAAALGVFVVASVVVILQLRQARLNLASALLQRAGDAQRSLDWGRAAAYYAASRIEHDTEQARWGYALTRARIPQRFLARRGSPRSMLAANFADDGSVRVIGLEKGDVLARTVEGARELWRRSFSSPVDSVVAGQGLVKLVFATDHREFLDPETGQTVESFEGLLPCESGPPTRLALVDRSWHLHLYANGTETRTVEITSGLCAVSPDGQRIAFRDPNATLHLWDITTGSELAARPAPDTERLLFTSHGLAIARPRSIDVLGGPEGDFSVDLPGRTGAATIRPQAEQAYVVSPDGHLLAVASPTSNQADLIDLRARAVIASVSYPPGTPALTFSPDGKRLLVSGLVGGSLLLGWTVAQPAPLASGGKPGPLFMRASANGHRFTLFRYAPPRYSYEIRDVEAGLLRSAEGEGVLNLALSGDGRLLAEARADRIDVLATDTGRAVTSVACPQCLSIAFTDDGKRLVAKARDFFGMMSVDPPALLWSEEARRGSLRHSYSASADGRVLSWMYEGRALVRSEGSANVIQFASEQEMLGSELNKEGTILITVTAAEVSAWDVGSQRLLWTVPNGAWVSPSPQWSSDGSIIILFRESLGTVLLDARTGERLANIEISRPGAFFPQENVLPDLRHRLLRGNGLWELHAMPTPDDAPANTSLQRVLWQAGLELRGVVLVDTIPPAPSAPASVPR